MINRLQSSLKLFSLLVLISLSTSLVAQNAGNCANPIPLTCGTPYSGTTVNGNSNFDQYSCGPQQEAGKEIIHTITITQASNVTATLSGLGGKDLDVHVLTACDETTCIGRGDNTVTLTALAAGTYYIVVDAYTGAGLNYEGTYTLNVTCTPSGGGSTSGDCANPIPLTCGTPYSGTTADGNSNFNSYNCGPQQEGGKEKIHTITITQASNVTATLSGLGGKDLDVHVLSACDATTCIGRGDNSVTLTALAAGTYYIVVDAYTGAGLNYEGTYTLNVTCTPSGGGSTTGDCANPIPLTCGTPYSGTTADGNSNFNSYNCGPQQEGGKEKIHTITITQASNVTATLSGLGGKDLDVHVLSACDANSCIGRGDNSVTLTALAPGTYYIVVDAYTGAGLNYEGTYTLNVTCTPSGGGSTTGDCANPIPLTCGTPFTGTTADGNSNFNSYNCGPQQEAGKEKIHTITITQASNVTATLSGLGGKDLDVHVLSACNATSCIGRGDNSVTLTALAPGTYYIVVDGYSGSGATNQGAYTLNVTCTPSGGGSTSGDCTNPIPLTCGTPYSGTTTDGNSNFNSYNCGPQQEAGKEKIHTITITQASNVTATLSGLGGKDLDVHVLSACDANSCIGRGDNTVTLTALAPGTYYIVVDAYTGGGLNYEGTYTLNVTCTPTGGGSTSGDCANPIPLTCGTPFTGTTVDGNSNFNSYNCGPEQEAGKEKIHTITITQASNITATLSGLGGKDLDVHVLSACDANSCIGRGDNTVTLTALAPGTYYIVVDGYSGSGATNQGAYTLNVTCTPSGGGGSSGCSELFFSEYVEGSSNNKALEIYNPTNSAINLTGYRIELFSNGSSSVTATIPLSGSIASFGTYVVVSSNAGPGLSALADMNSPALTFNGDDAIVLFSPTDTLDIIGKIDEDPGTAWTGGSVSTLDMTLIRKSTVQAGVKNNPAVFDPSVEWNALAIDDFNNLGLHTSDCSNNSCGNQITLTETICEQDSYLFDGQNLTVGGTYTQTLTNSAGCDSVTTLTLTVTPTQFIRQETICAGETYALGDSSFTQAGTYLVTIQAPFTCDSVILLELLVSNSFDTTYSKTVCSNPYLFGTQTITVAGTYSETFQSVSGCDSTINLNITFGNSNDTTIVAEICQGETYAFGNQNLTTTGSYSEVFSTSSGCDSTVNLTLSVKVTPLINITENNGDLVSSNGTAYQWYLNGTLIQDDTNQRYTPSANGVYTVVTNAFNGCEGTGTYDLQNVSINELLQNSATVVPNPSKGLVTISVDENVSIIVYNIIGEIVYSNAELTKTQVIDLTEHKRGVYMVKMTTANQNSIVKRIVLN